MQQREPGAVHPWHCDIESSDPDGRVVSVWIGLEHATSASALLLVPYSHRFGATVQEVRHKVGKRRDAATDADVESWARSLDERSEVLRPELTDGDALFFDGRLWHGSFNAATVGTVNPRDSIDATSFWHAFPSLIATIDPPCSKVNHAALAS